MGFKMFRMSISWSRLYPHGDENEPNQEGIEFYRNVFKELRKYDIEPLDERSLPTADDGR